MRKMLGITAVVFLLSLSACSSSKEDPKTEEEIKADFTESDEIRNNVTEVLSFSVTSTSLEGDMFYANIETQVKTDNETVEATAVMTYTKDGSEWTLSQPQFNIISVVSDNFPMAQDASGMVIDDGLSVYAYDGAYFRNGSTAEVSKEFADGSVDFIFTDNYEREIWVAKQEGIVSETYSLNDRWRATLSSQTYTEQTAWEGTWIVNGSIEVIVTGEFKIDVDASGNEVVINTLVGKYTIDGNDYVVAAKFNPNEGKNTRHILFDDETFGTTTISLNFEFSAGDFDMSEYTAKINDDWATLAQYN